MSERMIEVMSECGSVCRRLSYCICINFINELRDFFGEIRYTSGKLAPQSRPTTEVGDFVDYSGATVVTEVRKTRCDIAMAARQNFCCYSTVEFTAWLCHAATPGNGLKLYIPFKTTSNQKKNPNVYD